MWVSLDGRVCVGRVVCEFWHERVFCACVPRELCERIDRCDCRDRASVLTPFPTQLQGSAAVDARVKAAARDVARDYAGDISTTSNSTGSHALEPRRHCPREVWCVYGAECTSCLACHVDMAVCAFAAGRLTWSIPLLHPRRACTQLASEVERVLADPNSCDAAAHSLLKVCLCASV